MRWASRWARGAVALAAGGVVTTTLAAPPPLKELAWSFGTRTHRLRVGPPTGSGSLPGLQLPGAASWSKGKAGDHEGPGSEDRALLSVVGPIVSRSHGCAGNHGAGGRVAQHIETEWLDGFTFDLKSYLARNSGLGADLAAADFTRFAVVDWDGKDRLTLEIERAGCERSDCPLETATVVTVPPGGWRPWLEAARRGEGFLQRQAVAWWTTLRPEALARARSALEKQPTPKARREWIAREVHQRLHAPGTAAALTAELFPVARFASDVETQWAVADRLLYLARVDALAHPETRSCATPSRDALSLAGWRTAPARAALSSVVLCLRDDRALHSGRDDLERLRRRCSTAADPMGCARPELAAAPRSAVARRGAAAEVEPSYDTTGARSLNPLPAHPPCRTGARGTLLLGGR